MGSIKVTIATKNKGKLAEIQRILKPFGIEAEGMPADYISPEETGKTYFENSRLKAVSAKEYFERQKAELRPAVIIGEDSGIEIQAFNGQPGVYSKRFLESISPDPRIACAAVGGMVRVLRDVPSDRAIYRCSISMMYRLPYVSLGAKCAYAGEEFEASCAGTILPKPKGTNGFGYDPIFRSDVGDLCFGEADPSDKDAVSHRGQAFRKAADFILSNWIGREYAEDDIEEENK
jgi:XTP/dITP diphosphohydrolase